MNASPRSRRFALLLGATVASTLALLPLTNARTAAPAAATYNCTADISYLPTSGTPEHYSQVFDLTVGTPFVDDFSTTLREHVFTATANSNANSVSIGFNYFSDVTTFDFIDLDNELTLVDGRAKQILSGSQEFGSSIHPSYTVVYTFTVTRR